LWELFIGGVVFFFFFSIINQMAQQKVAELRQGKKTKTK